MSEDIISNRSTGSSSSPPLTISGDHSIPTEKLVGSANYHPWAASVKMWFKEQDQIDHLAKKADDICESSREKWEQMDAYLCHLLWQSIGSSLMQVFRSFETCYDVWTEASEYYSNDIQRLYTFVNNFQNVKQESNLKSYLEKVRALMQEFETLMPFVSNRAEQTAQREKFFIVVALSGLKPEYEHVRHKILTSSNSPSIRDTFKQLLTGTRATFTPENSAPVSFYKIGSNNNRPPCNFCNKLGHFEDKCWKKRGRPSTHPISRSIDVFGVVPSSTESAPQSQLVPIIAADYNAFLKYQSTQHTASTKTSHRECKYEMSDWRRK